MSASTVTLDLTYRGLGASIIGGTDAQVTPGNSGIFISALNDNGAAIEAGLQVGDELITVNGASLADKTHEQAVEVIKNTLAKTQYVEVHYVRRHSVPAQASATSAASQESVDELNKKGRAKAAREAYQSGDVELSRLAHAVVPASEKHMNDAGQYIKAAVFGGLDGIITTFAVVASVAGADLATNIVIIMGFANLFADGISMGFGEYLSLVSEHNYIRSERLREEWEFDNSPEGEITEMIELYEKQGFSKEEAVQILHVMAKHKNFFIDHMMVQELGMMPPDEDDSPFKSGVVMFLSFLAFGLIPLLSYIALSTIDFGGNKSGALFGIACGLTAVALFILGAVKSRFSTEHWFQSGCWVLFNGALAAGAAYLVGFIVDQIVDTKGCA